VKIVQGRSCCRSNIGAECSHTASDAAWLASVRLLVSRTGRVSQNDSRILIVFSQQTVRRRGIVRTVIGTARAKHMQKPRLKLVTPAIVNRTVTPRRPPNADLRTREHLTEAEVERLMDAARKNRWGHRDATMVLVAYRHGFRPAELVDLRWDQIDFASGALHVRRVKRGMSIGVRSGPQIGIQGGPPRFAFRTISVRPVGAGRGCGDGASAG